MNQELQLEPLKRNPSSQELEQYMPSYARSPLITLLPKIGRKYIIFITIFFAALLIVLSAQNIIPTIGVIYGLWFYAIAVFVFLGADTYVKRIALKHYQLNEFAIFNNFIYENSPSDYPTDGVAFTIGRDRKLEDRMTGAGVVISNYRYTVQQGKNSVTYQRGFMSIKLNRRLPNMLLDATANNTNIFGISLSNLNQNFSKNQVLALEGDFNKYFTLYCPKEYERDALYIFTPDLMQRLIQEVSDYDIEIIDDLLYVYSAKQFDLQSPDEWGRLQRIYATIGMEVIDHSNLYADEKVQSREMNIVSQPGTRLKSGLPLLVVVIAIFVFLFNLLPYIINLIGQFL